MTLENHIENYLNNPFPLWNTGLTQLLVEHKWKELSLTNTLENPYEYSIIGCINKVEYQTEVSLSLYENDNAIKLVLPPDIPDSFYESHGLELAAIDKSLGIVISKVKSALAVLLQVPEVYTFINTIVQSIQILKAEDSETDISYSHPDIPFSIFFSVCEEDSLISDLRVAESILHESMHLYLTLIENVLPLIETNTKEVFYSPWRDQERPLRGVLHGMFVFKAIKDFYKLIANKYCQNDIGNQFIKLRIEEIEKEFKLLEDFQNTKSLTFFGKKLSVNLQN
ncbi:HEXXH motif-containing putative peptide modification protein [Flavobacterium sp. SUN052]|uniref:aKG-HExxH-type peptide beta-hydroxylase n=1 Tax=Flavobacterium sp. SUN052 TaxID=3002441 RepID=UPI00237D990D|nr:HEXXH motif-containing putative peptide modification protein [Flavobacterium sp. SUN052]MEC4004834.1 HEXXH motif-containing putative peptide modification protein [Flavobacterium sp. SUN052]